MSKECIRNCPVVQEHLNEAKRGTFGVYNQSRRMAVGDPFPKLIEQCENSYDCPGPESIEAEVVVKGFIKKRTETVTQYVCVHPSEEISPL